MKKKVTGDIKTLVKHCLETRERSLFVIVGDKGRLQVANLHYLLQRTSERKVSVLWCYKKTLDISSNRRKRQKVAKKLAMKGLYDEVTEDPYELFLRTTEIRYCFYKESQKVLGQTFGMLVLQDFEALTPNVLCRTVETVEGGGIVIILLHTMTSLNQLYEITMDVHSKLCCHNYTVPEPRFIRRFVFSLSNAKNCMVLDDELNVLPIVKMTLSSLSKPRSSKHKLSKLLESLDSGEDEIEEMKTLKKLSKITITHGQLKALITLFNLLNKAVDKIGKLSLATIISARGRGKSATIGLFLSGALNFGLRHILIVAPSLENVQIVFKFLEMGLKCIGTPFDSGLVINRREGMVESILVKRGTIVRFVSSSNFVSGDIYNDTGIYDLMVIEEAASIPLPTVELLCKNGFVILSSTVGGYEGTGRSLSLKLIDKLRRNCPEDLTEIMLKYPIRYSKHDSVETWLNSLLCLNTNENINYDTVKPPTSCKLYLVDRDVLFSCHPVAESYLNAIIGILASSHYRNSPDDLLLLSDAPAHRLFVLLSYNGTDADAEDCDVQKIVAVVHVAIEGQIGRELAKNSLKSGARPSGDMIPWTLTQNFCTDDFAQLLGVRIVRLAVPQKLQGIGYGTECVKQLLNVLNSVIWFSYDDNALLIDPSCIPNGPESLERSDSVKNGNIQQERRAVDYVGTCFGLSATLLRFWIRLGFRAVYARQVPNEATGEYSVILIKSMIPITDENSDKDKDWLEIFCSDFSKRLLSLAGSCWRSLPCTLLLSLLSINKRCEKGELDVWLTSHDVGRLERYAAQVSDFTIVTDLLPILAKLFFEGKIKIDLSFLQCAILMAIGSQRKSPTITANELKLPLNQVMALLHKIVYKISRRIREIEEQNISLS